MSTGYLQIVFADHQANEFRTLGGAGFTTMAETRRRFREVPADDAADPKSDAANLILDLCDKDGDILDDKYITRATAADLMGADELSAAFSEPVR